MKNVKTYSDLYVALSKMPLTLLNKPITIFCSHFDTDGQISNTNEKNVEFKLGDGTELESGQLYFKLT